MYGAFQEHLSKQLREIENSGLFKRERFIQGPQGSHIQVGGREVLNFCANNYLGLSTHPRLAQAAQEGLKRYGYGLSSVRFICGTQTIHKELEREIAAYLGMEDS